MGKKSRLKRGRRIQEFDPLQRMIASNQRSSIPSYLDIIRMAGPHIENIDSVFRYSEKKYNDALVANGEIKIGTLYSYLQMEDKPGIQDFHEGLMRVMASVDAVIGDGSSEEDKRTKQEINKFGLFHIPEETKYFQIKDIQFETVIRKPDCFVLCLSGDHSDATRNAISDSYDSVVEITNIRTFLDIATATLRRTHNVEFLGFYKCKYSGDLRRESWPSIYNPYYPAIHKHISYRDQNELRAVWHPVGAAAKEPINPIVLRNIGLSKLCRRI